MAAVVSGAPRFRSGEDTREHPTDRVTLLLIILRHFACIYDIFTCFSVQHGQCPSSRKGPPLAGCRATLQVTLLVCSWSSWKQEAA
jgi:hypothetical protein